ncbi:unnamed protein product, partial [Mesorhabditis belari]|uniref:Uncharacterized protein n=1 Tax=Mesorhabditis belari TaxID=2138241 RepID=A0AAF3EQN3_9BILA
MVMIGGYRFIFSADPANTQAMAIMYFCIGCCALCCNLFNVYIFYSLQRHSKKYKLFIALEVGEIVNCIAYISTGAGRYATFESGTIFQPITTLGCFLYRPWSVFLLMGTQIPAALIMISVVERLTAVFRPSTYQRVWDEKFKTKAILLVVLLELCSLGLAFYSAWSDTIPNGTSHCPVTAAVLTFTISFFSLAFVYFSKREMISSKGGQGYFLATMTLTGICVIVMGFPAIVSLGNAWNLYQAGDLFFGISICAPSLISIATTFSNGMFHKDYRRKVYQMVGRRFGCHLSSRDESSFKDKVTIMPTTIFSSVQRKSTLTAGITLSVAPMA